MGMFRIGQIVEIVIDRTEPNFDKACEQAYKKACKIFGVDEDGHITNVENSARSTDSVVIDFKHFRCSGSMAGGECYYVFDTWVHRG